MQKIIDFIFFKKYLTRDEILYVGSEFKDEFFVIFIVLTNLVRKNFNDENSHVDIHIFVVFKRNKGEFFFSFCFLFFETAWRCK